MNRLRRWLKASTWERQDLFWSIRIYLLCSYLYLLLLLLHLRDLTIFLIHTNRAAKEIRTFDHSMNSTLYDDESLRHCHQTYVSEELTSIQTWTNPRSKSHCLYAFHLFVDASERVFRVQYAQRLRSWIVVRDEWLNHKALSIKNEFRACTHVLNKSSTSSSSRMKKRTQRLRCESYETSKTFSRRRIKDCFTVWRFEIMLTSNLYWLFRYNSRSQYNMYENIKSLFANSILFLLTIALTNRIFQNYATFEEIEAISSSTNEFLHYLRIKKNMLRVSFFQIVFVDELTRKIQEAGSFSNRTVDLSHRVEYKKNIEIHDIRKKALVKTDDKFSRETSLMRHADFAEMTSTLLSREWNSQITITQISSSTHTRQSWVRSTIWQATEIRNVASFIWKTFAIYRFIIILSCCNRFSRKWKRILITVSSSFSSTRRSKYWERNCETSKQKMKLSSLELDERNCIDESVSS